MHDLIPVSDTSVQLEFNWDAMVVETKQLLEEDRSLEKQQYDIMLRRAEIRVKIGFNLKRLQAERAKLGVGDFTSHAIEVFGISKSMIYDCMHVADRFGGFVHARARTWETWRELARPSTPDIIVEQVESKQIEATPQAIREAKEALKRAEEAERRARTEGQEQVEVLNGQIRDLQAQMHDLVEKERQEDQERTQRDRSPEINAQIDTLSQQVDTLVKQRNRLNKRVDQLTYERDNESSRAEDLAKKLLETLSDQKQDEHGEGVRKRWRAAISDFQSTMMRTFSQWPSPLDAQSFDPDDWARLTHAEELAQRFLAECHNLSNRSDSMIVEAE